MKISILCSDRTHPVNSYLEKWRRQNDPEHEISIFRRAGELSGGDILFLVSCSERVERTDREKYAHCLVLHASDLPQGRGWSPHIWEILSGADEVTLCLLEAAEEIDSGDIWRKVKVEIPKGALHSEIGACLFEAELKLMDYAVNNYDNVVPQRQEESTRSSYFPRRTRKDSQLDPQESIQAQFDKIRVSDPDRYPAYFKLRGRQYKLILEEMDADLDAD